MSDVNQNSASVILDSTGNYSFGVVFDPGPWSQHLTKTGKPVIYQSSPPITPDKPLLTTGSVTVNWAWVSSDPNCVYPY